jgi:integrase
LRPGLGGPGLFFLVFAFYVSQKRILEIKPRHHCAAQLPENIRMYDLRHTMATTALLENRHPKKVQDRLGHSSYQLTMDTYSHILPQMQDEVRNAIGNSIFSKLKKRS